MSEGPQQKDPEATAEQVAARAANDPAYLAELRARLDTLSARDAQSDKDPEGFSAPPASSRTENVNAKQLRQIATLLSGSAVGGALGAAIGTVGLLTAGSLLFPGAITVLGAAAGAAAAKRYYDRHPDRRFHLEPRVADGKVIDHGDDDQAKTELQGRVFANVLKFDDMNGYEGFVYSDAPDGPTADEWELVNKYLSEYREQAERQTATGKQTG